MEQKQKDALWAQYTKQTHRLGRVLSLVTVALLLGDRSGLRYAARNELAIAGIYHAVAVSGMHVSILLGMILLLGFMALVTFKDIWTLFQ